MSILVFIEGHEGAFKKSSLEAASYAAALGKLINVPTIAIAIGNYNSEVIQALGANGISKTLHVDNAKLNEPLSMPYATVIAEAAKKVDAKIIIFPRSAVTDALVSRLGVKLNAGVVTNVLDLPDLTAGFKVKRSIYTGKAFAYVELKSDVKILTIAKNTIQIAATEGKSEIEKFTPEISDKDFTVVIKEVLKATGDILLTEADIVVSGGRGLKGPENWQIILDLAKNLGAATGCSKPVSDLDWRPHHEHVGQTGVKVSPNIYIAIGISGAIQHLAGVNSSKVIVVINKDPEAPFFKAADYGIAGDLFEILPKLITAAKELNK